MPDSIVTGTSLNTGTGVQPQAADSPGRPPVTAPLVPSVFPKPAPRGSWPESGATAGPRPRPGPRPRVQVLTLSQHAMPDPHSPSRAPIPSCFRVPAFVYVVLSTENA